jgi:hypothetical protein
MISFSGNDDPQRHGGEKALLILVSLAIGVTFGARRAIDFTGENPVLRDEWAARIVLGAVWPLTFLCCLISGPLARCGE